MKFVSLDLALAILPDIIEFRDEGYTQYELVSAYSDTLKNSAKTWDYLKELTEDEIEGLKRLTDEDIFYIRKDRGE